MGPTYGNDSGFVDYLLEVVVRQVGHTNSLDLACLQQGVNSLPGLNVRDVHIEMDIVFFVRVGWHQRALLVAMNESDRPMDD